MNRLKIVILIFCSISIELNAQDVRLCVGGSHEFGVPPVLLSKYYWTVSDSSIATITSSDTTEQITVDLNNTGLFQLIVKEENIFSCIGYDSILVEILPLPTPNIYAIGPVSFCEGDSVLLKVDSVYSAFLWNNNANSSDIYADTTDNYFVTVTDANGCSNNSDSISINSFASPIADFIIDGICLGSPTYFINQSVIPLGQTPSSIWYLGNGDINYGDSIFYTYNQIGSYDVSLSLQTDIGCKDSLTQTVSIIGNPEANFIFNPLKISTLEPEISFVNTSLNAFSLLWDFGDSTFSAQSDPYHIFDDPGIYNVMLIVEDINKCRDSITKNIIMYYDFVLHVPTAFTPNNDGDNDTFGPNGLRMEKYKSYEFLIYNKWGEKIFETNDINESWAGADLPVGVYNWVLVITDELGKIRKRNGMVTLIR